MKPLSRLFAAPDGVLMVDDMAFNVLCTTEPLHFVID